MSHPEFAAALLHVHDDLPRPVRNSVIQGATDHARGSRRGPALFQLLLSIAPHHVVVIPPPISPSFRAHITRIIHRVNKQRGDKAGLVGAYHYYESEDGCIVIYNDRFAPATFLPLDTPFSLSSIPETNRLDLTPSGDPAGKPKTHKHPIGFVPLKPILRDGETED